MKEKLIQYVLDHTARGECQCGRCVDKGEDRPAPNHSVDLHFFWVSMRGEPKIEEFKALLKEYPNPERLKLGPSYIELGAALDSQEIALRFLGLGGIFNLWDILTPASIGFTEPVRANTLAENGLIMMSGYDVSA
jgi:hypothetical protein